MKKNWKLEHSFKQEEIRKPSSAINAKKWRKTTEWERLDISSRKLEVPGKHFMQSESEVAQSCLTLCDLWTVAHQAPPSMGFSRQEYWSGLPFPSPGDLSDPGIEPRSPTLQADALTSAPPGKPLNTRIQSLRKPPIETRNFRSKY